MNWKISVAIVVVGMLCTVFFLFGYWRGCKETTKTAKRLMDELSESHLQSIKDMINSIKDKN